MLDRLLSVLFLPAESLQWTVVVASPFWSTQRLGVKSVVQYHVSIFSIP